MAKPMIDLTTERDTVARTVPYQFRPTMRVNRETRVRVGYHMLRPRTVALALLAVAGAAWALWRLIGAKG